MKTYHIGLNLKSTNRGLTYTAQFQACKTVDGLSCENYEYYGERETTKVRLALEIKYNYHRILNQLKSEFPKKQIEKLSLSIAN